MYGLKKSAHVGFLNYTLDFNPKKYAGIHYLN